MECIAHKRLVLMMVAVMAMMTVIVVVSTVVILTHTQWIDFCNKLPSTVLRVKGIVPTTSGPMELQYTLQSCSLTDTHLKDYHLVIIGTDIDISSIQEKVCSAS